MASDWALRYMTRFRCIGPACENHCCWGWNVFLDRENFERVRAAMRADPAEAARFRGAYRALRPAERKGRLFGRIVMSDEGSCPLRDPDGLCHLQARYGEAFLSDTCAVYPRRIQLRGDSLELTGVVSCPEVARQLLLAPDGADLVPYDRAALPRFVVLGFAHDRDSRPYWRHLGDVRDLMLRLLRAPGFSLEERLFFVAYFAQRSLPWLQQGLTTGDTQPFLHELRTFDDERFLRELARRAATFETPAALVMILARELVHVGAHRRTRTSLRDLTDTVFTTYGAEPGTARHLDLGTADLFRRYRERKAALMARAAERFEQYSRNFAAHYWVHRWHTESPQLLAHTLRLLTEWAVQKFLFFSHPALSPLIAPHRAGAPLDAAELAEVDRVAVEVFHKTASFVEHSGLLQRLERALDVNGLASLAGAVYLLRF